MNITASQQVLCSLIAHNLFGKKLDLPSSVDWSDVLKEGRQQSVTLLAFNRLKELPLPEDLKQKTEAWMLKKSMLNISNLKAHGYLHNLLNENGIPYCILKGAASAHYYPSLYVRNMGDVDFYIAKEDIEKTAKLLEAAGFESNSAESDHHIAFHKSGIHFELHFEVSGVPKGKTENEVRALLCDLIESSIAVTDDFVTYQSPDTFHHGLIMLLHLQRHILSVGIGLRHLCDWAVFVNSMSDAEFKLMFEEKLKEIGLWKFAKTISLVASLYIGLDKKDWMGQDTFLANEVAEEIFAAGNFGKKAPSRYFEGMLIANSVKDDKKMNRLQKAFFTLNRTVRKHWPIASKFPLLYPAGWVYFSLRYFFLSQKGKRIRFNVFKTYRNSGKRNRLYSTLRFFEKDK